MRRYPRTDPVLIACFAIGVSFFMAGIWHGLSRGWLLWGAMRAVGLVTVRFYRLDAEEPDARQIAAYRNNRFVLVAMRVLTIEYAAIAFAVVFLLK